MANYLVLSALATNRPGLANDLTRLVSDCGCNVLDSRMTVMGGEFAISMLVSGEWNSVAKIEHLLPSRATQLGMTTMLKRTEAPGARRDHLPFRVEIVALDDPGIIKDVTEFFAQQQINIEDLFCDTFPAPHTQAPIMELQLLISVPTSMPIASLRETFAEFCDDHNLDATMELIRN